MPTQESMSIPENFLKMIITSCRINVITASKTSSSRKKNLIDIESLEEIFSNPEEAEGAGNAVFAEAAEDCNKTCLHGST